MIWAKHPQAMIVKLCTKMSFLTDFALGTYGGDGSDGAVTAKMDVKSFY